MAKTRRPKGKKLAFCLEYLVDMDADSAAKRAGYQALSAAKVRDMLKEKLIQDELERIKRFTERFFETFDLVESVAFVYQQKNSGVAEAWANELIASASVQSEMRRLRSGDVDMPFSWKRFADKYYEKPNGTQAYMDVFNPASRATAATESCRLLKNPKIQAYLRRRREDEAKRVGVDQEWVLRKLIARVEVCLTDVAVVREDGGISLKQLDTLPRELLETIREISRPAGTAQINLKLPDGGKELGILAQYTGLTADWNTMLASARKYGYVVRRTDRGYELVEEQFLKDEALEEIAEETVSLPWETDDE